MFIPKRLKRKRKLKLSGLGLIATYKIFKADSKIKAREGDAKKRKNIFITFVTLGYENDRYIDVVLWGCHKLSKIHCIMGEGEYEPEGHWIKVDKVKYDFLK